MSSNNRRDPARALRPVPKAMHLDEPTAIDARAPRFSDGPRHGEFPSFTTPVRSASSASRSRAQSPAATPPNVIPFTKPRAIAAVAAADPKAVVTMAPSTAAPAHRRETRRHSTPPAPIAASPAPAANDSWSNPTGVSQRAMRSAKGSPAPAISNHAPVSTGWTPPHGVKPVAQPASAQAPSIAVTAWPAANAPSTSISSLVTAQRPAQSAPLAIAPVAQVAHVAHVAAMPAMAPAQVRPPAFAPAMPAMAPAPVMPAMPPAAPHRQATQMPAAPVADPHQAPQTKWAEYNQLGLGQPKLQLPKLLRKINSQQTAKLIVNAYRLLGFAILTIIVIVLVGYIASTAFYYFSNSWIVPMAVSATDEKVVSLSAQLAEQQNSRDRIADELQQAERSIASQQTFQAEFAKAIRSDLEGRKLALGRIRNLATNASRTRTAIKNQNSAYANASRKRMQQEYAAGLIDRNAMLSGGFQLAQISSSNLSLAERQAEFETRAADLEAQTRSLDAILANAQGSGGTALSYEVLRIKQEYEASRLDLAKAIESRDTLKSALARQNKIVAALQQSAYLRAVREKAQVAFVPYSNISKADKGTSLYACKLGMLFCYHVGEVLEVMPGEVQFKHPQRDRMLRGQMVVLKLDADEADAAADDVLFVGGRPILF